MKIYVTQKTMTVQERDPVGLLECKLYQLLYDFKSEIISINVTLSDGEGNTHQMEVMR
jgi:hypothetical protein